MRSLERLRIKNREIDIEGEKLKIYGLTFPELSKFAGLVDKNDNEGALNYLLKTSLRKSITKEEMNDEQLDSFIVELSSSVAVKIIQEVKNLSGLDEVKEEKKL